MSLDPIPTPAGRLYVGALRDVADDPDAALGAVSAATLVCLVEHHELERRHPAYLEWVLREKGGRAVWFPIQNFGGHDAGYVVPIVDRIVDRLASGVVMHCFHGQGRAGTMAAAVLIATGADQRNAVETVAAHRTFAGPVSRSQWDLLDAIAHHYARRDRP